jgi:hypothetical protein
MTSDLQIESFTTWLSKKGYKDRTIYNYVRPLKIAAEKGLSFAELDSLDMIDFYCMVTGHQTSSRNSARNLYQGVLAYRDFIWRTGGQS